MQWVAIDLGGVQVKASILDNESQPMRLSYPMSNYETTLLLSEVVLAEDQKLLLGEEAIMYGLLAPETIVFDWKQSPHKLLVAEALLRKINDAVAKYYNETDIGAVLLHDKIEDTSITNIAKKVFNDVKTFRTCEVINKRIFGNDADNVIIADFGAYSFRVSYMEQGIQKAFSENCDLGFNSVEVFPLINYDISNSDNNVVHSIVGEMLQRAKILLNGGNQITLPMGVSLKKQNLNQAFEQVITSYFYQCLEECSNMLSLISKSWEDVSNVIFIGGGAESFYLKSIFDRYIQGKGVIIKLYNGLMETFDAQYAATNCAIQMPLREETGVKVKF